MAAQLMDSDKGKYLVYCSKCSLFYVAEPTDGMYVLKQVNPKEINFIPQPYMLLQLTGDKTPDKTIYGGTAPTEK